MGVMVSTGLRFELDKAEDDQMVYRLEPYVYSYVVLARGRSSTLTIIDHHRPIDV